MAKWTIKDHMEEAISWHDMNQVKEEIDSRVGYDLSEHMEEEVDKADNVNNPSHYTYGNIECIDYLRDNMPYEAFLGFLEGNAKKYMHRWRHKGKPLEDLSKAVWCLDRLIEELEGPDE